MCWPPKVYGYSRIAEDGKPVSSSTKCAKRKLRLNWNFILLVEVRHRKRRCANPDMDKPLRTEKGVEQSRLLPSLVKFGKKKEDD